VSSAEHHGLFHLYAYIHVHPKKFAELQDESCVRHALTQYMMVIERDLVCSETARVGLAPFDAADTQIDHAIILQLGSQSWGRREAP
jgi:hypothetical protein